MDAFEILVVILSVMLAVFLAVGIVLIIAAVKLINKVKEVVAKAEDIIDDVEAVSGFFRKTAAPVAITGLIGNIVSKVTEFKNKKGKK